MGFSASIALRVNRSGPFLIRKPCDVIIPAEAAAPPEIRVEETPEELIFDKAEEAEEIELLRLEREELNSEIDELKKQFRDAEEPLRSSLQRELDVCRDRREAVDAALQATKEMNP